MVEYHSKYVLLFCVGPTTLIVFSLNYIVYISLSSQVINTYDEEVIRSRKEGKMKGCVVRSQNPSLENISLIVDSLWGLTLC